MLSGDQQSQIQELENKEESQVQLERVYQANLTIQEIHTNFHNLIRDLEEFLDNFNKPTNRRKKNIDYLKSLLVIPNNDINQHKFKTADRLAAEFYFHIHSELFTTGALGNSRVRDNLDTILKSYFPEMYNPDEQECFFESLDEFEYAIESIKSDDELQRILEKLKQEAKKRIENLDYANSVIVVCQVDKTKNSNIEYVRINEKMITNIDIEKLTMNICKENINHFNFVLESLIDIIIIQEQIRQGYKGKGHNIKAINSGDNAPSKAAFINRSLKARLDNFTQSLSDDIAAYKSKEGDTLSKKRKQNIKDIEEIITLFDGISADKLAKLVIRYLKSEKYHTRLLNRSKLREALLDTIKDFCPRLFIEKSSLHSDPSIEDYDDMTAHLERSFKVVRSSRQSVMSVASDNVLLFDSLVKASSERLKSINTLIDLPIARMDLNVLKPTIESSLESDRNDEKEISQQLTQITSRIGLFCRQFANQRTIREIEYSSQTKLIKSVKVKACKESKEESIRPDFS